MAYLSDSEKLKKKKVLKMKKSLQKEEADHKLSDFSGSDDEEIDFTKEIHPIGYYINDREKMIEQMFSVIKNNKLRKMLPPVLKKYSLEEIKADCLVHLLGMSKKRIFAILQGRDLNSSSDSESDTTNSVLGSDSSQEPQITSSTHVKSDVEEIDDTLDISVSKNDLDALIQDKVSSKSTLPKKRKDKLRPDDKHVKKIKAERSPTLIEISDDEIDLKKKKKEDKKPKKKSNSKKSSKIKHKHAKEKSKKIETSESNDESSNEDIDIKDDKISSDPKKGKSLLEILELEMRARAIRALLESVPNSTEPVPSNVVNIKPDPENEKSEKIAIPIPGAEPENSDGSDSAEVIEIVNDNDAEDAIVILDDTDEQMLETEKEPQTSTKEGSKNDTQPTNEEVPKNNTTTDIETDVTWSQRWAESKGVKTVIQNSKICANIRKRMRFARMLKQKQQLDLENQSKTVDDPTASQLSAVEEGSVDQLELIKQLDAQNKANESHVENEAVEFTKSSNNPEDVVDEPNNCNENEPESNEVRDTESSSDCTEKLKSSKSTSDVEIIEKNIECHIDLTDC